ncbi:hypothetical protein FHR71_000926 [Methylobacterium sp. RAS18]|nr:hypothetical protein [Methylobacterium sp. RAS18]
MSALADLTDAGLADLIDTVRTEIVRRNDLLRDHATPAARSLVNCRRYALIGLTQAEERLRAGAATDLPSTDLPAPDGPGVFRGRVVDDRPGPYRSSGYPQTP